MASVPDAGSQIGGQAQADWPMPSSRGPLTGRVDDVRGGSRWHGFVLCRSAARRLARQGAALLVRT